MDITVKPCDITSELAVRIDGMQIGAWRDNPGIIPTPRIRITDARWSGSDLCITLENGEKFEAEFTKVTKFSYE